MCMHVYVYIVCALRCVYLYTYCISKYARRFGQIRRTPGPTIAAAAGQSCGTELVYAVAAAAGQSAFELITRTGIIYIYIYILSFFSHHKTTVTKANENEQ